MFATIFLYICGMEVKEITKAEKPGYITVSFSDIENILSRLTKHHYNFNGWYHVFTDSELSKDRIDEIQAECDDVERFHANEIAKDIDRQILETLKKEHPEYFRS